MSYFNAIYSKRWIIIWSECLKTRMKTQSYKYLKTEWSKWLNADDIVITRIFHSFLLGDVFTFQPQ